MSQRFKPSYCIPNHRLKKEYRSDLKSNSNNNPKQRQIPQSTKKNFALLKKKPNYQINSKLLEVFRNFLDDPFKEKSDSKISNHERKDSFCFINQLSNIYIISPSIKPQTVIFGSKFDKSQIINIIINQIYPNGVNIITERPLFPEDYEELKKFLSNAIINTEFIIPDDQKGKSLNNDTDNPINILQTVLTNRIVNRILGSLEFDESPPLSIGFQFLISVESLYPEIKMNIINCLVAIISDFFDERIESIPGVASYLSLLDFLVCVNIISNLRNFQKNLPKTVRGCR